MRRRAVRYLYSGMILAGCQLLEKETETHCGMKFAKTVGQSLADAGYMQIFDASLQCSPKRMRRGRSGISQESRMEVNARGF